VWLTSRCLLKLCGLAAYRAPCYHTCHVAIASQLHGPCHPPPHSCLGHIATPLAASQPHRRTHHLAPPPLQLDGPHHHPLTAAHAMLPRTSQLHSHVTALLQPHTPHHHMPRSCAHHVITPFTAAQAMSPRASQLHGPHRCPPRSCTCHIATHLTAAQLHHWPLAAVHTMSSCATHTMSPCASQCSDMDPVYILCRTLYLFIIAGIYLLNPIDCNASKHYKHFRMNYKVSGKCL